MASEKPKKPGIFYLGPLWRHSAATLARSCHLNSVSFMVTDLGPDVKSQRKLIYQKQSQTNPKGQLSRGHQQTLCSGHCVCLLRNSSGSKAEQTPEAPPSWVTVGSQMQNHYLHGTDSDKIPKWLSQSISQSPLLSCVLPRQFLRKVGRISACSLEYLLFPLENLLLSELSLGKSGLMITITRLFSQHL